MPHAQLYLRLLGPFSLCRDDWPVPGFDQARVQHLLAYLVLHRSAPISRQQLAYAFWPDTTDQQALKNFRTLLTRLRHALGDADEFIEVTNQTIRWRSDAPLAPDVAVFEAALAQAAEAEARGERTKSVSALAAASAAYAGDLLPDCYDDWILPLRERLHRACGNALERLVLLLEEEREYRRALPYAERLLQHDSLHEPAYRHLMRLHLALGQRAEARRIYDACVAMLRLEFGTAPGRATQDIYERWISIENRSGLALPDLSPRGQPAALPLIGRKAEWVRALEVWHAAAAGAPQLLLLAGEAGIGKTRLAEELCAWVARHGVATATARCYPRVSGVTLPYAPVAEWLSDPALSARLANLDDDWLIEVARIVPALAAGRPHLAPPGPLTEPWQRTRLFEVLARAVLGSAPGPDVLHPPARAGARGEAGPHGPLASSSPASREGRTPLLLFLDDLQWVDRETLDWLDYLLRFNPRAPLLVVSTVRPQEVGKDQPLAPFELALTRAGLLCEIPLAPLDAEETAALAAAAAGRNMETAEAAQIFRDSEGNPLFVVEMVRAGISEQVTAEGKSEALPEGLAWDAGTGGSLPALPPKVRAVIAWRLGMLSTAAQAVAQTAAAIGRKFSLDILYQACDQDEMTVNSGLDELWHRQVVRELGDGAYDFAHEGIRAAAYAAIGPVRRRGVHLRVAQAFEALRAGELDALSGQIAAHYEQAGEPQGAIRFYRRAAAAAQRIYANEEAVRLYRHLLEGDLKSGLSVADVCEVKLALAEVWRVTGLWVRAQTIVREALAAAERLGDARLVAQTQAALADVLQLLGYYDDALAQLARAEQGFTVTGEWRGVISALWTMGQIYWFKGDHPQALTVLDRQLAIATERDDARGMCEALETMGMVYWSQGDWDRSAECCLQAIRMAGPLAYQSVITRASITLGNVRSSQHWFGEAVHWYLSAGLLARQINDRRILSWAVSNIAQVLAKRGDHVRAIAGYQRSLRNAWEIRDRWTACLNIAGLSFVNERLGRLDLAESLYRKAIDFGVRLGIPSYLSGMLVGLARLLLACGRAAEARDFYGEALSRIASVAGERLAGEDTRFDARVLGVRLRHALGELSEAGAAAELTTQLSGETSPPRQAALQYELWRLAPENTAAQAAAAAYYRAQHEDTGAEESRRRYHELAGEVLPDPLPLPDISELIPDETEDLELARVLAEMEASFG